MSEETNEFSDRAVRAYEAVVDKYTRAMLGDLKMFVKKVYSSEIIEDAQQVAYNKGYSAGFGDGSNEAFEKGRLAGIEEARKLAYCDPSPIEPGDEVASSDNVTTFMVTHVSGNLLYGIGPTGGVYSNREIANWHKTGKHYDLNRFLQMIGGGAK